MNFFRNHNYVIKSLASYQLDINQLKTIRVELNSHCQLKCPGCWRFSAKALDVLSMGMITIQEKQKKFIPEIRFAKKY